MLISYCFVSEHTGVFVWADQRNPQDPATDTDEILTSMSFPTEFTAGLTHGKQIPASLIVARHLQYDNNVTSNPCSSSACRLAMVVGLRGWRT